MLISCTCSGFLITCKTNQKRLEIPFPTILSPSTQDGSDWSHIGKTIFPLLVFSIYFTSIKVVPVCCFLFRLPELASGLPHSAFISACPCPSSQEAQPPCVSLRTGFPLFPVLKHFQTCAFTLCSHALVLFLICSASRQAGSEQCRMPALMLLAGLIARVSGSLISECWPVARS